MGNNRLTEVAAQPLQQAPKAWARHGTLCWAEQFCVYRHVSSVLVVSGRDGIAVIVSATLCPPATLYALFVHKRVEPRSVGR